MIEPSKFDLSIQAHRAAAIGLAQELERRSVEGELARKLRARPPWPQGIIEPHNVANMGCFACLLTMAVATSLVVLPLAGYRGCIGSVAQFVNPWPEHLVMVY